MATLSQLEAEPWWDREIVTSPMVGLGLQLRGAYGTGALSIGIKGNVAHLSGGHRSQEWIKNSAWCTNRNYATQAGLAGDQLRYCSALDFAPAAWGSADNRAKMIVLTRRVIDAMKAGRCDELVEVFGTLDGEKVAGWRNDLNVAVSSDSSHLDHIHLRFDRRYVNDNAVMSRTAAILLEDDMAFDAEEKADVRTLPWTYNGAGVGENTSTGNQTNGQPNRQILSYFDELLKGIRSIKAMVPAGMQAKLDAILAAAQDDGDTTVVLPPDAIADLQDIKAALAAVPDAVLDAEAGRLAG